jgi:hypothetical protein
MTEIRTMFDDQERDPATVLWTTQLEDGEWVALLSDPHLNYVIAKRNAPFVEVDGGIVLPLDLGDLTMGYFSLGRPEAGQLGVALVTSLINNSDEIIGSYIDQLMAR